MKQRQEEETELLKNIGGRIRYLRILRGLTQEKLAFLLDSEKASVSRMEAGQINATILMLRRIATVLEVSLSQLLLPSD